MKTHTAPARRAMWLLLAAPALIAIPAFAQEAPTAPPPVRATVPQAAAPAPAPVAPVAATPAPAPVASAPTSDAPSRTTIAPGAADVIDDARLPAARATRAAPARQAIRTTTPRAPVAAAPVAVAPEPVAPEPVAQAPAPEAATPVPEAAPLAAPDSATATDTTTETATTTTGDDGVPIWPIALIAVLIVAAGAFFVMRRRRASDDEYVEEAYYEAEPVQVEPVAPDRAFVAPSSVAAAPIATVTAMDRAQVADAPATAGPAEDATVSEAPAADVAALTDGAPPVRNRPWLEFAMRPVRAGTSADEALVEIELTVANSGTVEAQDVRVSTFMLTDAHASEMERMMVDAPSDAAIDPVNIAPGEGARIDATLAALKADLGVEGAFNPVIVAEARYRLADGSEGRTAASFVVGVSDSDGGAMTPIDLSDRVMRDDIEAQLHGEVEHA